MKGVVCAGGRATRLGELTRISNKHLLPVWKYPMIYYPLRTLEQAGIRNILIVTGQEHAGDFIDLLGDGQVYDREGNKLFDLDLTYKVQTKPLGIAHAISLAEDFANGEKIVVILGDNIIEGNIIEAVKRFDQQPSGARIFLKEVPDPWRFGCPRFSEDGRILEIIEKPTPEKGYEKPPSNYAVVGIYMYDSDVFDIIRSLKPSERGELEITDVNNAYLKRGDLEWEILRGWWRDVGTISSLYSTSALIEQTGCNKLEL
jgi:glucose-1-phosphate thymidylyltransferase